MATMLLDMADGLLDGIKPQQEGNVARLETSFAIDKAWLGNLASAVERTFAADQAARDPNTQGLMLLVEDFFKDNYRDITSRETIEWGKPEKTADGNFSIRYKYRAKIWDKATVVYNDIFTFNKDGDYVSVKKLPYDVSTREGIMNLVEDFFVHNYRDITSRETIEWGEPAKTADGNFTIRYKYRTKIWDKETKMMKSKHSPSIRKGDFVSVRDVARDLRRTPQMTRPSPKRTIGSRRSRGRRQPRRLGTRSARSRASSIRGIGKSHSRARRV